VVVRLYVVVVYDVAVERINKIRQFLKQYLNWIQNSAFEGELTVGSLAEVKVGLKELIDENQDSIIFFIAMSQKWLKKEVLGIEKSEISSII